MELSGTILAGASYEPVEGRLVIDDGRIQAVEETSTDSTDILLPAFVNAHTHVGDSIAKEAGRGLDLDELVAPPDGLKHRLLREATPEETVDAIRRTLRFMHEGGTTAFLDFREGGVEGVRTLQAAAQGVAIEPILYGRSDPEVLEIADGYGASGSRDDDFSAERAAAENAGKPFAIHAGERDADDIQGAFELDPDFLVHMVYADTVHLEWLEETATPVVVCPRSNLVTGVGMPPIKNLLECTTVGLGTDNVMLNSPSMFREMEFVSKLCDVSAPDVLRMATSAGAKIAGLDSGMIEPGRDARLLVLDGDSDNLCNARDPVRAVVRRAGVDDVKRVISPV
ncbi:MAG: amidohydrolase family protein [Natronomonas sp.]